ncbi:signal transduction histidine kinase/phage shock protein PspC (stress-responsive transcriptional regulator) [Okibacterium sp. HSC-33S16]|uniref:ATP-binding protein n=1 Tax=Okibacterium sp. HSC-33S16 TaxID=2910965 RepID=UPI00209F6FB7|nr:ATP-binding protein [Okibacterium sp. HSC-33S16]MCP2031335.1 signal transduction histidine kinase/phage shock protein PspC (stress-responsive transcriptional regulator) [Okibacterium sp. HSC-33S16]
MDTALMTRPRVRLVGGVCAGFADHTGLPLPLVRTLTVVLSVCGGAGLLMYLWLWVVTPVAGYAADPLKHVLTLPSDDGGADASRRSAPVTEILLGMALLAAAAALVAARLGADVPLDFVIPAIVVLGGAGLAWRQFDDLRQQRSSSSSALVIRALGALILVALGILLFFVTGEEPNVWTVFAASIAVLVGVAIVVAPWVVRLSRDLADERAARVREADRAEIAAHLHDSVLQTLALIQQKADPASEASRLARAQERELRDWLFAGSPGRSVDLADELRRIAAVIEEEYAVRIEVVSAGQSPSAVPDALLGAAREALLNAARHAGGTVSVYLESSPTAVELTITDRGPGFTLDDIPSDRMGVRESILGRMRRIGGTAELAAGPGGAGTEIRLLLPLSHGGHHDEA